MGNQSKTWNNGRTNLIVDGDCQINGELNKGRFAQIDAISSSINQLEKNGFLGDLNVRGSLYQELGQTWVGPISNSGGGGFVIESVVYAGSGIYVVVGSDGAPRIERSLNYGATWSAFLANPFTAGGGTVWSICNAGGVLIAGASLGRIARSTDSGATWGALIVNPFGAGERITSLAYGAVGTTKVVMAGSDSGHLARSLDLGLTWNIVANPFAGTDAIYSMTFVSGVFVATGGSVAAGGHIARSVDMGATWGSLISNPFTAPNIAWAVSSGNNIVIAVGSGGIIARSLDLGLTWTSITNPYGSTTFNNISFGFNFFQVVGQNTIGRSYDNGVTWQPSIYSPFVGAITVQSVAFSEINMLAGGGAGYIATSGWTPAFSSAPEQLYVPSFVGFGTPTNVNFSWRQVANRIKVMGKFTSGVTTGVEARVSLPFGMLSDSALIPSIEVCGILVNSVSAGVAYYTLIESGIGYITIGAQGAATAGLTKQLANGLFANGQTLSLQFEVPIAGLNQ